MTFETLNEKVEGLKDHMYNQLHAEERAWGWGSLGWVNLQCVDWRMSDMSVIASAPFYPLCYFIRVTIWLEVRRIHVHVGCTLDVYTACQPLGWYLPGVKYTRSCILVYRRESVTIKWVGYMLCTALLKTVLLKHMGVDIHVHVKTEKMDNLKNESMWLLLCK